MRLERIPLFPLNVVLFPGADLPLHIFEPRYRQMVWHCVEDKSEFGMLLALPKGIVRVGCTAEITQVMKRYNDGRMDILTVGRAPFRIVELLNAEQYEEDDLLEGQVDYLDDQERAVDARLRRELVQLYEACYTMGSRPAGAATGVSQRVGAASTEDRSNARTRGWKRTRSELNWARHPAAQNGTL